MSELDVMFTAGLLVVLANFTVSRMIRRNDDSNGRHQILIEVASLGLLIVSFIIYIIIIS
jgi:hypothetical protein